KERRRLSLTLRSLTLVNGWHALCRFIRNLMVDQRILLRLLVVLALALPLGAQESKPTIRHHRIAETAPEDPNVVLLNQAETAMQQNDFASAEAALQKVVAAKPDDYRAWFDLGYVYSSTQRSSEAISAYQKSLQAKPDI